MNSQFKKEMDDAVRAKYGMTFEEIIDARLEGRTQYNDEKVAESYRLRGLQGKLQ